MLPIWITLFTIWTVARADVSHIHHHYEPQYNLEPAATITHRPIYTIPPTRYDQVVAASSHAERYNYDPPAEQFNPYVAASEQRNTYSAPHGGYDYHAAGSAPKPTFAVEPTKPTVYVNDNRYNYEGYSGRPTYAGFQHTASPTTHSNPQYQTAQAFRATYAGYQPVPAASEIRKQYAGYQHNSAAPSYQSNAYTPSFNAQKSSYQSPSYSQQASTKNGQYNHKAAIKNGMYNPANTRMGMYQHHSTTKKYQPQASENRGYYSQTPFENYQTAATRVDTNLHSDGYHYDKPSIPFDPAPVRTPDAPSRLYEDAPPLPSPVRKPTSQYLQPKTPHNYYTPTQAPTPLPTPPPIRFNPAPVIRKPTPINFPPPPVRTPVTTPAPVTTTTPITRIEDISVDFNTTPSPPLVRITPRTTPRPRTTPSPPIVNTTPFIVTVPPPKVSDVVLLAYSASTISPHISPDVYSPPPDVSATVRPYRVSDPVLSKKIPDPTKIEPAPFLVTKPVTAIRGPQELQTSASEDQFQYLPPSFGRLEDDGYHYERPSVPFY